MKEVMERTPYMIAAEINSIKEQTRNVVLFNSIEIGRRLLEAKSLVEHGQWGDWLKNCVNYSQSTANNLMKIFQEYGSSQIAFFGDNAKSQALGNLSYTQAVLLLGVPEDEREQFVKENDLENMSTRELQQAIKERDELREKLDNAKNTSKQVGEELDKLREEKINLESTARTTDKVLRDTQADVKTLQEKLEDERQQRKSEVEKLTGLLDEAKVAGSSSKKIKQLQTELEEALQRVEQLTAEINKPVVLEPAVIEKIPEDIERELSELRNKAKELEEKSSQNDAAVLKYGVYFDTLVTGFKNLLGALAEIKETDANIHEKYKNAVRGLIKKMEERL